MKSRTDQSNRVEVEQAKMGFKQRMGSKSSRFDRTVDAISNFFGTPTFLFANGIVFIFWIALNQNLIPSIEAFDPYPFNFLTMTVSLEAIFLSIIVLMSQNRAARLAEIREETDFEVNFRSEAEITKILRMLDEIHDHLGLEASDDEELSSMKKDLDLSEIEAQISKRN